MGLKPAWKAALAEGGLLILSIFGSTQYRRSTATSARQRNTFVAAPVDKICIAHASEGSKTLEFAYQAWHGINLFLPLTHQQTNRLLNLGRSG